MNIYVRRKKTKPFGGLLLTFVLGVAIGFSIAYAFFGGRQPALPRERASETPHVATPAEETAIPEAPATPPPEAPPAAPAIVEKSPWEMPAGAEGIVWPGRFLFLGIDDLTLTDEMRSLLKEVRPGGVMLKAEDLSSVEAVAALVAEIKDAVGLGKGIADPPFIAVAQEGGALNPLKVENAPSAEELGRKKDLQAARDAGRACGEAAVARGMGVLFAPVLNVQEGTAKEDEEPYVATERVFGSGQGQVALTGLAFADGIREAGAVPIAKYYPGIGLKRKGDSGAAYTLDASSRKLAELMYPFSEAAAQGLPGIIVGHIAVPEIDRTSPSRPASISPVLVQTILRDKFHYEGLVLADDLSSDAISAACPPERALVEALAAGCDGALFPNSQPDRVRAACRALEDAPGAGTLTLERLIASGQRWKALGEHMGTRVSPAVKETPAAPQPEAAAPAEDTTTLREEPVPVPEPAIMEAQPVTESAAPQDANPETAPPPQPPNTEKIIHEIKRGETLGKIAAKYGVRASDILMWNGMADANIKYGFKLIIYRPIEEPEATEAEAAGKGEVPPPEGAAPDAGAAAPTPDPAVTMPAAAPDPAVTIPMTAPDQPAAVTTVMPTPIESEKTESTSTHTVAKGENIYRIAAKYRTTVQRLTEMNKLEHPEHLVAGQKLRVPSPPAKR